MLLEKGGKARRIPAHHVAHAYLRAYVETAGVLSGKAMQRGDVLASARGTRQHAHHAAL